MTAMPKITPHIARETEIKFSDRLTDSELRNGYVKTAGLQLSTERSFCLKQGDMIPCVRIEGVTSRGNVATGFIRMPADPVALRQAANYLNAVADEMAKA